ncbi:HD domain-containing phosphohydrolase [Chloroflexota bacterium]
MNKINIKNKKLDLLYDVALRASSFSEVSKLIVEILGIAQRTLDGLASSLLLVDESKSEMYFQAAEGVAGNKLKLGRLNLNSGIAGWVACNKQPLLINDVYRDKRFNRDIDKATDFVTRSVVAVPLIRSQKTIGVLEVINKADGDGFNEHDLAVLREFASTEALLLLVSMAHTAINNIEVHERWLKDYQRTAETIAQTIDAKDTYALGHSSWVRKFTMIAANSLPLASDELRMIEIGALLHDIGKIGINEKILCKTEPLTDEEWGMIRQHPVIGAQIVGEIPFIEKARDIILYHHERFDGKGYPQRLQGEDIPLGARLVAVADAFDTMVTEHSYRTALTVSEAVGELIVGSGTQFCPLAVETFISAFKKDNTVPKATKPHNVTEAIGLLAGEIKKETKEDISEIEQEIFRGDIQLLLPAVPHFEQVRHFRESLGKMANLKIAMVGWSDDDGYTITVSLSKPTALIGMLNGIPFVEDAYKTGKGVVVMLKPTDAI